MKKILFMISDSKNGGAQINMIKYVGGFKAKGYSVALICPPGWLYNQLKDQADGIICSKISLFLLPFLYKTIQHFKPDIICTQLFGTALYGGICAKLCGVEKVFFILNNPIFYNHISLVKRITFPMLAKLYTKLCKQFLVKSQLVRSQLLGIIGQKYQNKVSTIKNGVDFEKFCIGPGELTAKTELGINSSDHIVLSIGRLSREKGYDVLLKAASICLKTRRDFCFLIAGEGELNEELHCEIISKGLENHVKLLGYRSDTPFLLASCNVFVLPSCFEGLPNALMEAMAMAKPVVATNVGGAPELITHGQNGYLVTCGDHTAMAGHILKLLSDEAAGQQMGQNARSFMLEHYEIGKVIDELTAIFES